MIKRYFDHVTASSSRSGWREGGRGGREAGQEGGRGGRYGGREWSEGRKEGGKEGRGGDGGINPVVYLWVFMVWWAISPQLL